MCLLLYFIRDIKYGNQNVLCSPLKILHTQHLDTHMTDCMQENKSFE